MSHTPQIHWCRRLQLAASPHGHKVSIAFLPGLIFSLAGFATTVHATSISHVVAISLTGCIRTIHALDPGFPMDLQSGATDRQAAGELTARITAPDGTLVITCHGQDKTMRITHVETPEYLPMSCR